MFELNTGLSPTYLILFLIAAMLIGMSKAGLSGLGLAIVPLMAIIFGARESTGIILPMLIAADIMAVIYYKRHAVWKHIIIILPWVGAGIIVALVTGNMINDRQFRTILITVVWIMLAVMLINDFTQKKGGMSTQHPVWANILGFAGGFATMIGNAAGPVFTLYFLARRLPKNEFIGTGAWLYLIMNTGKLPLQAFAWKNITPHSLQISLIPLPVIILGMFLGIYIVKLIPEKAYRYFVIVATLLSSILLFL
jgi:uncharacterized membrane protein YfcA